MLWVGLTGGIGAGKSAVSSRLVAAGAALVDADTLAREVVAPGTPGLDRVVAAFGPRVLAADGGLDRAALAATVFGDDAARRRLNAIVHPLVGERTAALAAAAEADGAALLVHDVPLLVENGLAPLYHLVVVVEAAERVRLDRLTRLRGMTEADARARLAAQAGDAERRAVADVVLVNDGPLAALHERVDALLAERLRPYADNLAAGRPAPPGPLRLVPPDPQWAAAGERLVARLRAVCGTRAVDVAHIGSTAVPGLAAKDVIDLQVTCADPAGDGRPLAELAPALAAAGFPGVPGVTGDPVRAELDPDPGQYRKRLHRSADPQRPATVHVRPAGSTAARLAVGLRDLLRADPAARQAYAAEKARLLAGEGPGGVEPDGERYAEAKTPFLLPLLARVLAGPPAGGSKACSCR